MLRHIGILLFPEFQLLDGTGPAAAFELAEHLRDRGRAYQLHYLSAGGGAIRSTAGAMIVTLPIRPTTRLDTLLIAGGRGTDRAGRDAELLAFIRRQSQTCRRVASVCTGAFVLGAAGLLNGKRATTHWRNAAHLQRLYPEAQVEPDRIHVHDGKVWTSAGVTAGIDLALAMIAQDLGEDIARATAQEMVVYYRRPGGQSQFSALLDLDSPEGRFSWLLSFARTRLREPLTVERLAAEAGMSPRNFARCFTAEVGITPARAVERMRLEAARERVEFTPASIEEISEATGFGHVERMRRAFVRAFGQPPQALRRAARAHG